MPYDDWDDVTYDKLREAEMQAAATTERLSHEHVMDVAYRRLAEQNKRWQEQINHNGLIEEVYEKIKQAEDEITAGSTVDARQSLNSLRKKHGL